MRLLQIMLVLCGAQNTYVVGFSFTKDQVMYTRTKLVTGKPVSLLTLNGSADDDLGSFGKFKKSIFSSLEAGQSKTDDDVKAIQSNVLKKVDDTKASIQNKVGDMKTSINLAMKDFFLTEIEETQASKPSAPKSKLNFQSTAKVATGALKNTGGALTTFVKITSELGTFIAKETAEAIESSIEENNQKRAERLLEKQFIVDADHATRLVENPVSNPIGNKDNMMKKLEEIDTTLGREVTTALEAAKKALEVSDDMDLNNKPLILANALIPTDNDIDENIVIDEGIMKELAHISPELCREVEYALKITEEALTTDGNIDLIRKALQKTDEVATMLCTFNDVSPNDERLP